MMYFYWDRYLVLLFSMLIIAGGLWAQTNPTPFDLSGGDFFYNAFTSSDASVAYHAIQLGSGGGNDVVSAQAVPTLDWPCAFNLTSRARFNDSGTNGLEMVNTSDGQSGSCGDGGQTGRRPLAMMVAINTTDRSNINVTWRAGTVTEGDGGSPRLYNLELQYRIGTTGVFTPVDGGVLGSSSSGSYTNLSVGLPAICEDEPVVQLRWVYYQTSAGSGGTRPRMRLDNIQISSSVALPVELSFFIGKAADRMVELSWRTATEQNNAFFDIERSADGRSFEAIGQVAGQGDSQAPVDYTFVDAKPLAGLSYYRLRQVDYDGAFAYYGPLSVNREGLTPGASQLWPIPAQDRVWLQLPTEPSANGVEITLYDLSGQLQWRRRIADKSQLLEIPLTKLPAGIYLLRWYDGSYTGQHRLVVE